ARAVLAAGVPARRAGSLDPRPTELPRDGVRQHGGDRAAFECRLDPPDALLRAADSLLESLVGTHAQAESDPLVTELTFALLRLTRVAGSLDVERFAIFLRGTGRDIELDLRCVDASEAIANTLKDYRAHVRF